MPRFTPVASPVDPYKPIEKRQLVTPDAMRSKAFSVRLADPDYPSGWKEVGVVSADYLLVPNGDVRDFALSVAARAGGDWQVSKQFFDGKRFAFALALRDRNLVEVKVGDAVGLGLLFENSYDGSRRLSASLFVNRLACTNGMLAPSLFRRVSFKHDDTARDWEAATVQALRMVEHAGPALQRFAQAASALACLNVTTDELARVRASVLPDLPVSLWGKVVDRFLLHEEQSGWGLLNAATNVVWHSPKPTVSDLGHNEYVVRALTGYVSAGGDLGSGLALVGGAR